MVKHRSFFPSVVVVLSLLGPHARADITEFELPNPNSGPGPLTVGPDGNLWVTEVDGNRIARFKVEDSTITEFELPHPNSMGRSGITVGPDNNLWFCEYNGNRIGTITLDGNFTEFDLPNPGSGPAVIRHGPDGNLWFTEFDGNRIGTITPQGDIVEFPIPTANSGPLVLTVGPDGNLWFTEFNASQIGRITPSGQITEFALSENSAPQGIVSGPDGNIWFAARKGNRIGRITPDGVVTQFDIPTPDSMPLAITVGPDTNLWFTEYNGSRIGQITTDGVITEWEVPTPNSLPLGITTGPEGNIWFTERAGNKIGRLDVRTPANHFLITAAPNAISGTPFDITVTALWSAGNIDTNYQGTVILSSSDSYPGVLPADYTFTSSDQGTHTFSGGVTLLTAGVQTLTAQDTAASSITGSATVVVVAAPASQLLITAPATVVSGTPFDVMLAALDRYGNVDMSYGGTVTWTSSDPNPGVLLPPDYPFQPTDNGMVTFPAGVTLITLGNQTLTATDTVSGITGSATIMVGP
jgi:virginiamycin B lyase